LKIAGHARNQQYQQYEQYEQRPAAQRAAMPCVAGIEALRTPSPG
jgi:hypothetical protein